MKKSAIEMNSSQKIPPSENISDEDQINFVEYFDIALDNKWLIASIAIIFFTIGIAYAIWARPVFEANLMVQVEDSEKSAGSFLGDAASSLFDVKTPSAGEIEIIRSRMILGQAVENTKLYIEASPRYTPLFGRWLSSTAKGLSEPGFLGFGGFVSGAEEITVPQFDVPAELEESKFYVTVMGDGSFLLSNSKLDNSIRGKMGEIITSTIPNVGNIKILVSSLSGKKGAQFELIRYSKQLVLNALQDEIKVTEKGKQSGVIDVSWQNSDANKLVMLLNEIGRLYVRQNIERKSAEAEKTLGFLNTQLPEFKRQLEKSENVYNVYRNEKGTVSLDEEAKNALAKIVDLQAKLLETQQKRRELAAKFTDRHPAIQTVDTQIAAINSDISQVNSSIKKMPLLQQDTVRMQRDIKVNTDLYVSLLNSSLQMNLAKEGKVGNVRLLDDAVLPEKPVKPKKAIVIGVSLVLGIVFGCILSLIRNSLFSGIRNPDEIEAHTGLNVYSTIPLSAIQASFDKNIRGKLPGIHLLVVAYPQEPAVESLRSLRTALQFATIDAPNNRVLISGATPGVGKSFVSANFAALVASTGKRVLLIDADLRKGYMNQVFALPRPSGLSELIAGSKNIAQVVHSEVIQNLDVITTGVLPPNPAELLMSESFIRVLDELSDKYDLVIIDTAPILVAADTVSVAPHAGTLLLVARAEKTQVGELKECTKRLQHVGCHVNGVILNALDLTRRHYGSYGYKYGGYRYSQYKYGSEN